MFHLTTCPTCQTKFTIPEGAMGKRQVCPHCQSPFLAGKSISEGEAAQKLEAGGAPGIAKTMLGETAPPIKYNCPRCKMPLEAPSIEAGTKKPCPGCGQRLQVPAAPPSSSSPAPALNKTMLAETEPPIKYNCPTCKKPLESPASEGGAKKPCPACGQRLQVPAAPSAAAPKPNLNKTILATDESKGTSSVASGVAPLGGQAAQTTAGSAQASIPGAAPQGKSMRPLLIVGGAVGGLLLLGLLSCVIMMVFTGPSKADREKFEKAQKDYEKAVKDLDELKKSIQLKEVQYAHEKKVEAENNKKYDAILNGIEKDRARYDDEQKELTRKREFEAIRWANDQKKKEEADRLIDELQRKLNQEKAENERKQREAIEKQRQADAANKANLDALRAEIQNNRNNQERQTVIISQPPQPIYYPPFHPFGPYFRGW